jgi:hypothetical protein
LGLLIRLNDDFPPAPLVPAGDNPPALKDVRPKRSRVVKHSAEINLVETPVQHAFHQV